MRFKILLTFTVLCFSSFCISCSENPPENVQPEDETEEPPSYSYYNLTVKDANNTQSSFSFKGDSVKASWDDDGGLIWLGTDDDGSSPFGTLTLTVSRSSNSNLSVSSGFLSLSNLLSGEPDQIDARLYSIESGSIVSPKFVNNALIYGDVVLYMRLSNASKPGHPEVILVQGDFCAID